MLNYYINFCKKQIKKGGKRMSTIASISTAPRNWRNWNNKNEW